MIYIFIFAILFFLSLAQSQLSRSNSQYYVLFILLLFILHDGLRCNMGTDWGSYYEGFIDACNHQYDGGFEILYTLLLKTVCLFTSSYTLFLLLHATIIYTLYFYWLRKFVPDNMFVALLVFYASMIGLLGMNRQHIAMALCLAATPFLLNKEYRKFIVLCALAVGFHRTAIVFPLIAAILTHKVSWKLWICLLIIILIARMTSIGQSLFVSISYYLGEEAQYRSELYMNLENNRTLLEFFLGFSKRILILILLFFQRKHLPISNPYFRFSLQIYLIGILMVLLFDGSVQILVSRFVISYLIFECVLWGYFIKSLHASIRKIAIVVLLCYCIFTFYRSIDAYPMLFIPYRSILTEQPIIFYK